MEVLILGVAGYFIGAMSPKITGWLAAAATENSDCRNTPPIRNFCRSELSKTFRTDERTEVAALLELARHLTTATSPQAAPETSVDVVGESSYGAIHQQSLNDPDVKTASC